MRLPSEIIEASIPAFLHRLAEVRESLSNIDATRSADLSQDQKEWWVIVRVAGLLLEGIRSTPARLGKSERPDFVLTLGNQKIAIEVTEVVSPLLAEAMNHPELPDVYSPSELFLDPLGLGERRKWAKSTRRAALAQELTKAADVTQSPGAGAGSWEKRLADLVLERISKKDLAAKRYPDIATYERRVLVLYDRASPAGTRLEQVIELLSDAQFTCDVFQEALLLSDGNCCRIIPQP